MDKKIWITIFLVLVIPLFVGGYFLYPKDAKTLLSVAGEGKAKAVPDLVSFTITYAGNGTSTTSALADENKVKQQIISLLASAYGVNQSDIQVSFPSVGVNASSSGGLNYQVANTLNVNFRKLASLDEAISKLYETNKLSIANLIFTTNNARDLEDEAIKDAVKDGELRAAKIAQAGNKKLGKLVSITAQQTQAVGSVSVEANMVKTNTTSGTSNPGQIEITRNVSLVYELK